MFGKNVDNKVTNLEPADEHNLYLPITVSTTT
mgnify:CR=1 FL=1